jgi:Family of unknown function (DUF6941)
MMVGDEIATKLPQAGHLRPDPDSCIVASFSSENLHTMSDPHPGPERPPGIRCHLAAICDGANVSAEGKLNILGEFDRLTAPALPVSWPLMFFVAKLKLGAAAVGHHSFRLRVLDEDMHLVSNVEGEMEVPPLRNPGIENDAPMILGITNARFSKEGTYLFELLIDGLPVTEGIPLNVVLVPR